MVRQLTPIRYALLALVLLAAGCAGTYPPAQPPPGEPPAQPSEQPSPDETPPPPVQDARAPTLALLRQSERSADDGDVEQAIAYVERAIRLNPRDPVLWLRLARLQLAAQRPAAAQQMAHKAIALSAEDAPEVRQGWLLVADALEAQGEDDAAARIRERWRTYRG